MGDQYGRTCESFTQIPKASCGKRKKCEILENSKSLLVTSTLQKNCSSLQGSWTHRIPTLMKAWHCITCVKEHETSHEQKIFSLLQSTKHLVGGSPSTRWENFTPCTA